MSEIPQAEITKEAAQRRRRRSIALGIVLGALVVIFYVLTIIKMAPGTVTHGS